MPHPVDWQVDDSIVSAMALASLFIWWRAAQRVWAGQPLLARYERQERVWSPAATLVGLIWVVHSLVVRAQIEWRWYSQHEHDAHPLELIDVQQGAMFRAVQWGLLLGILVWSTKPLEGFGIRFDDIGRQLSEGVQGFLASLLPVGIVLLLTDQLGLRDPARQHDYLQFLQKRRDAASIVWVALSAVVLAPLVEELLFRVVLQGAAQRFFSPCWSIVLVAAAFSAVHGWVDALALFPLAVVLGYIFYRRHSYLTIVIVHALFNLSMLVLQLLTLDA